MQHPPQPHHFSSYAPQASSFHEYTLPAPHHPHHQFDHQSQGFSITGPKSLSQHEEDMLAHLDRLKFFLATAPSRWAAPAASSDPHFSYQDPSSSGNNVPAPHPAFNRFLLPSGEYVSCVLWNGLYHITGLDVVRALVFRFHAFGRPVRNMKKFEEGVFGDLRNLRPGTGANVEEPKSPFLGLLFKYECIRTQKKQKVFFWFSVPHDRLFFDALERGLKRERMGQEPTSVIVGEPARSFTYDRKRTLFEQFKEARVGIEGVTYDPKRTRSSDLGEEGLAPHAPVTIASSASVADVGTHISWISPTPVKVNGHLWDVFAGTTSRVGKGALKSPRIGDVGNEDVMRSVLRRKPVPATSMLPSDRVDLDPEEEKSTDPLHSGSRQAAALREDEWQQFSFSLREGPSTASVYQPNPMGSAVAGLSTWGALTSAPRAAASSATGPSTVNTASSSTSTAATSAKRKLSDASPVRKRKRKDLPNKVAIPESSSMFSNNSHATWLFRTPLQNSTPPTTSFKAVFPQEFYPSTSSGQSILSVGGPGQARSWPPADVENWTVAELEVPPDRWGTMPPTLRDDQSQEILGADVFSWTAPFISGLDVEQQRVNPSLEGLTVFVSPTTAYLAPTADVETLITWISPMPVKVNGHFCDVFEGTHSTVGKVALKRPRIGTTGFNEDIIRRFQREAETWARLQHPHILEYLGSFQRDGHFYFVSPFMENGTLVEYIELHLSVNRIKLVCETADAIAYLHQQDVVHGDIKASNLLIGGNAQVLLCDFGLTRTTDFRTSTAMKGAGTLRWQSPELWDGDSKSFKSDVYAFGITIAEILTGQIPFPELQTDGAVIRAVLIEGKRLLKNPAVSSTGMSYENVWGVAEACWSAIPEERIPMSEALQRIKEDPALAPTRNV